MIITVFLAFWFGWSVVRGQFAARDDMISAIASQDLPDLHPGPYSTLSPADRSDNSKRIMGFCLIPCVSNYGMLSKRDEPTDRLNAEFKLCLDACALAHLPADHPEFLAFTAKVRQELKAARAAGSTTMLKAPN